MKRSLVSIASAAGLLWLAAAPALADSTSSQIQWSYNFTPSQTFIAADAPGSGTASFTNEQTIKSTNSSEVEVTNLKLSSTASWNQPDTFTKNGAWAVSMVLTDSASGASNTMTFTGKLSGTFSALTSNVSDTFTGKTSYTWTAPNGNKYTVSLDGATRPGPPTDNNAASISAYVSVSPPSTNNNGGGNGGHTAGAPEPSSLILSFLGLGFAGLASWQKRRRSLATVLA